MRFMLHRAGQIADRLRPGVAAQILSGLGGAGAVAGRGAGPYGICETGEGARRMLNKEFDDTGEDFLARGFDRANAVDD